MLSTTIACLVCFYGILIKSTYSFMSPVLMHHLNYLQQRLWILLYYTVINIKGNMNILNTSIHENIQNIQHVSLLLSLFCVFSRWLSKAWSCFVMELSMLSLSNGGADMMHVFVSHQNLLVLIKPSRTPEVIPWKNVRFSIYIVVNEVLKQ